MSGRIRRSKKEANYTVIPNEIIRAKDLSWKAKGLMCYLLSLQDDWEVYKSDLANRSKDGYESMLSGWKELEDLGYIDTIRIKKDNLFTGYEYIIHESRVRGFTEQGFREHENPELISNSSKQVPLQFKIYKKTTFVKFWELYPIKVDKKKCEIKWNKLKKEDIEKIFLTLVKYLDDKPFETYRFPNPLTYLNGERWNDDTSSQKQNENDNEQSNDISDEIRRLRGW